MKSPRFMLTQSSYTSMRPLTSLKLVLVLQLVVFSDKLKVFPEKNLEPKVKIEDTITF